MMPVMRRPPEHAFLRRRHGHESDDELKRAAGLERTMRKITVIAGGDEKHAHDEHRQSSHQAIPVKGNEKNQQRGDVHEKKRQGVENRDPRAIRQRDS